MKYKLTDETKEYGITILHRIICIESFDNVEKGDKGGWIEKEENLSQIGCCWVYDDACVYGNAYVHGDAKLYNNAEVHGNAEVYGNARICDNSKVFGYATVFGETKVFGEARVFGNADITGDALISSEEDYIVFKNNWSSGRYFTWTKSNNMWTVGCFHGTGEELIKKAYQDDENKGKHYEAYVKFVEQLNKLNQSNNI